MISKGGVVIALLALLSACAHSSTAVEVPPGSAGFRAGFINGCAYGRANANTYSHDLPAGRDTNSSRYRTDLEYRTGFDRGNKACYEDERNTPRVPSGAG